MTPGIGSHWNRPLPAELITIVSVLGHSLDAQLEARLNGLRSLLASRMPPWLVSQLPGGESSVAGGLRDGQHAHVQRGGPLISALGGRKEARSR